MNLSDPLGDMLTRIRNAQMAGKARVEMPGSKLKAAVAEVLKQEGYISDFAASAESGKPRLSIASGNCALSLPIRTPDEHCSCR